MIKFHIKCKGFPLFQHKTFGCTWRGNLCGLTLDLDSGFSLYDNSTKVCRFKFYGFIVIYGKPTFVYFVGKSELHIFKYFNNKNKKTHFLYADFDKIRKLNIHENTTFPQSTKFCIHKN